MVVQRSVRIYPRYKRTYTACSLLLAGCLPYQLLYSSSAAWNLSFAQNRNLNLAVERERKRIRELEGKLKAASSESSPKSTTKPANFPLDTSVRKLNHACSLTPYAMSTLLGSIVSALIGCIWLPYQSIIFIF